MTKRRSSLTGSWSGAYRYPVDSYPETVFNAQIEEIGGAVVGTVQEPNLLRPWLGSTVTAEIEGTRNGAAVNFVKFYSGDGGMDHAIRYEGSVDGALMRIEGKWTIPGTWSGTFFMVRDDEGEAAEAEEAFEETIEVRR